MNFLFELVLGLTLKGAVYGAKNKKVPFWLRILLRVLLTVIFVGCVLIFGWMAIKFDQSLPLRLLLAAIAIGSGWFYATLLQAWLKKK